MYSKLTRNTAALVAASHDGWFKSQLEWDSTIWKEGPDKWPKGRLLVAIVEVFGCSSTWKSYRQATPKEIELFCANKKPFADLVD